MKKAKYQSLAVVDTCIHYSVTVDGSEPKIVKLGFNLQFGLELAAYQERMKKEIAQAFAINPDFLEVEDITPEFPLPTGPHEGHSSFRPGSGYETD